MNKYGFTLIELLVAIAVFTVVVAIGVGGFVHALHTQTEISSLIATESNASVALEQMARELRTGELFCATSPSSYGSPQLNPVCNWDAGSGIGCQQAVGSNSNDPTWECDNLLDFYNADGSNVDYQLSNGTLGRSINGIDGQYTPLTANDVHVVSATFYVFGNTEGDIWPPRITIVLKVAPSSTDPALAGDVLDFQTTVSAREIDCNSGGSPQC